MHVTDAMQQNVADTMGEQLKCKKDENEEKMSFFGITSQQKEKSAGSLLPITFANIRVAFCVVVKLWSKPLLTIFFLEIFQSCFQVE